MSERSFSDFQSKVRAALDPLYDVAHEIGRGVTGVVYQATDNEGNKLAIKVLRPEFAATVGVDRFKREAQIMSELRHPGIVPVHKIGEEPDVIYFVMPYAGGDTLRSVIDSEENLSLQRIGTYVDQLASAIDYAHTQNVVHRDLKPENVMVQGESTLICDFGVARAIIRSSADLLTTSGLVVGTPKYMSPEQATGRSDISAATDIYALGCMTFEMMTGQPPFTGQTVQAIIARHIRQPPPAVRTMRPEVPVEVESAIIAALAKEPSERPETAGEFARTLQQQLT